MLGSFTLLYIQNIQEKEEKLAPLFYLFSNHNDELI